jgi:hypothetical protein
MNRELVLGAQIFSVCGALTVAAGLARLVAPDGRARSGQNMERTTWHHLWLPLLPAASLLALLLGWALQEPGQTDEPVRPLVLVVALPVALIWGRAIWRALRALRTPPTALVAAAIGLLRPRVVISDRLRGAVDERALRAAEAHERAHVRHHDPLRIWLAQLATDAQWPGRAAAERFERWTAALELARDEEARSDGVPGEDLASVVVSAARLGGQGGAGAFGAAALLTGAERALALRVDRLLAPLLPQTTSRRGRLWLVAAVVALGAAAWLGLTDGDLVVRALPIIRT